MVSTHTCREDGKDLEIKLGAIQGNDLILDEALRPRGRGPAPELGSWLHTQVYSTDPLASHLSIKPLRV